MSRYQRKAVVLNQFIHAVIASLVRLGWYRTFFVNIEDPYRVRCHCAALTFPDGTASSGTAPLTGLLLARPTFPQSKGGQFSGGRCWRPVHVVYCCRLAVRSDRQAGCFSSSSLFCQLRPCSDAGLALKAAIAQRQCQNHCQ